MYRSLLLSVAVLLFAAAPALAQSADLAPPASVDAVAVELTPPAHTLGGGVLYSNGSISNSAGTGVGGADESILEGATGASTYGYGAQNPLLNAMADDFTVPAGETWTVDQIVLYSYQTGSTTTSTITGVFVEIFDGPPSGGGTLIHGDLTTNVLESTTWTGVYRVSDTDPNCPSGTCSLRPIMEVVADVDVELGEGTYWVAYNFSGTLASGPWNPPVASMGSCNTGNAQQSLSGGAFAQVLNGTCPSEELLFEILGADVNPANEGGPEAGAFVLEAPRPNPARDAAVLALRVTAPQHVRAEALDLLGRRVAVLHDGLVAPDAAVALTLDTRALPAGVYVVRAVGEQGVVTQRVTVAR
jgi:hypothetical protein